MSPKEIVDKMMAEDAFSKLLGMEVKEIEAGSCILEMQLTEVMLNGMGSAHGALTYALSDSALAFASNAYGWLCVSVETSISHLLAVKAGDRLRAVASEIHRSRSLAHYEVNVQNQRGEKVAYFKGLVKISTQPW